MNEFSSSRLSANEIEDNERRGYVPRRPCRTNRRVREMNDVANLVFTVDGRMKWLILPGELPERGGEMLDK